MMVMKNKSIDDIFEGFDLNDEELLKEAEEVDNSKVDDVNQPKDSKNIISADISMIYLIKSKMTLITCILRI